MQGASAISDFLQIGGGFLALFIFAVLIVNAVLWLFLPWIMLNKMNEMIKHLRNIEAATESTERNTRPPGATKAESAVKYRIPGLNG